MKQVLTNFSLFVDGRGYAGKVKEFGPPEIAPKTLDYLAGGMAGTLKVPMGQLEELESSFTLIAYDLELLKHFGLVCGETVPLTARGSVCNEEGAVQAVVVTMRGHLTKFEPGTWKPGEEVNIKCTVSCVYAKYEQAGTVLFEADLENMVLIVDGSDQLAATRAALGI